MVHQENSMKFSMIYLNNGNARTEALKAVYAAINNGSNLAEQQIVTPFVQTIPKLILWSSLNLPLHFQCEHVEYKDGQLTTLSLMVIEAEVTEKKESL